MAIFTNGTGSPVCESNIFPIILVDWDKPITAISEKNNIGKYFAAMPQK
ncbi:MAG: hypothetical protein ABIJ97_14445 [Bacteroidota bacterium]